VVVAIGFSSRAASTVRGLDRRLEEVTLLLIVISRRSQRTVHDGPVTAW